MKKIILFLLFLSPFLVKAQTDPVENVTVSGAITSPDPTDVGVVQQMCFSFAAVNGVTLQGGTDLIRIEVVMQDVDEMSIENAMITQTATPVAPFITWTYQGNSTWEGIIDGDLPNLSASTVCFDGMVVNNNSDITDVPNQLGVGLDVTVFPHLFEPAEGEPDNNTFDYTFTILPIELGEFTAEAVDIDAELNWTTLTEINNSHFEVERSLNGSDWEFVSRVESKAVDGNSVFELNYNFTDKSAAVLGSSVFYRLKQVDLGVDAISSFTPIRLVTFDENVQIATTIFPTIVTPGTPVNIQSSNIDSIQIFNVTGELVNVLDESGVRATSINTSGLARGLYIVVLNDTEKLKFVVQ